MRHLLDASNDDLDTISVISDATALNSPTPAPIFGPPGAYGKVPSIQKQVAHILGIITTALPDNHSEWPVITDGKAEYVLERWIHKKRPRTSWVYDHGLSLVKRVGGRVVISKAFWICNYYSTILVNGVTTSIGDYLNGPKHRIYKEGSEESIIKKRGRIDVAFT